MRSRRLYFAVRSLRHGAPDLMNPAFTATAISAMLVSSVSPERCDMTIFMPFSFASSTAASVSVSVPIWFGFTSSAFAALRPMPSRIRVEFVTNRSSPTSMIFLPSLSVTVVHAGQSSSPSGSSIEQMGYFSHSFSQYAMSCAEVYFVPRFGKR